MQKKREEQEEQEDIIEYETSTMGEILRNARLKQGKTLRSAADELCIRRFYLEAIEGMDFENIPPAPYGTGFIRSYAQYLGLNSERILLSYRKSIGEIDNGTLAEKTETPASPKIGHIILGLLGLALLGGAWIWNSNRTAEQPIETENFENDVVVPEPEIIDEPDEQKTESAPVAETSETMAVDETPKTEANTTEETIETPAEEPQEAPKEETVSHMQMKLVGPTWVELKQNGKVLISNVYKKGFTYDIPAEGNITVSVGRYYNAEFWLDGQKIKVVTAMRKKNVSLNQYMQKQKRN